MSLIELIKRASVNYMSVKIALTILTMAASIPLLGLWYWGFDSAYLAGFGVGPEVYSRPVFASKLMLTWFVLGVIKPGFWLLLGVAALLFCILFTVRYRARKTAVKSKQEEAKKPEGKLLEMANIADESLNPALALVLIPGITLFIILGGMVLMSQQGKNLAALQLNAYTQDNVCPDTFNNEHRGCYSISGEPDSNYFVIANNERAVIFLSRKEVKSQISVSVNIKDKLTGQKVIRALNQISRTDVPVE